jgi:hypothetical protein
MFQSNFYENTPKFLRTLRRESSYGFFSSERGLSNVRKEVGFYKRRGTVSGYCV